MTALAEAKYHLFKKITAIIDNDSLVNDIVITCPPDPAWGDLSLACFVLAKINKTAPTALAAELAAKIEPDEIIASAAAAGPYVNFILRPQWLAAKTLGVIDENYGASDEQASERVMIEYANVNTHKEFHIGHLRNICYGDAVAKLLANSGCQVRPVSYVNDFGSHVAKTLWRLKQQSTTEVDGYELGRLYAQASQEAEAKPAVAAAVAEIMRRLETKRGADYALWKKTRQWSLDYFQSIYERLNIKFKEYFYESEVVDEGREQVFKLLKQGVLTKSRGAIIADLSAHNLGVLVILRADGTALYPVADLALAVKKFADKKLTASIYVVDKRQSLYFQQLFKILAASGIHAKLVHLSYDFVKLPQGMMSSRSGRVITFEEVYRQVSAKLTQEIATRHADWPAKQIAAVVKTLTVAVLKFEMVKINAAHIITFDINEALRLDGFTAIYLEYAVARLNSLFKKAKVKNPRFKDGALPVLQPQERQLLFALAKYPDITAGAAAAYEPAELAKYLFELAQLFNDYYQQVPIIQADKALANWRLGLAGGVRQVLINGLNLLGIETVEQM